MKRGTARNIDTTSPAELLRLGGITLDDGEPDEDGGGDGRWAPRLPRFGLELAWRGRPAHAHAHVGHLFWTHLGEGFRVARREDVADVLPGFLKLWRGSDQAIAALARRAGPLGVCRGCGRLFAEEPPEPPPIEGRGRHRFCRGPSLRKRAAVRGPFAKVRGEYQSEPLAPWRAWSLRVHALLLLVAHLRCVEIGRSPDARVRLALPDGAVGVDFAGLLNLVSGQPHNAVHETRRDDEAPEGPHDDPHEHRLAGWLFVQATLEEWQRKSGTTVRLEADVGERRTQVRRMLDCPSVFAVIVEQVARAIAADPSPRAFCAGCGVEVEHRSRAGPGSRTWCSSQACKRLKWRAEKARNPRPVA